MQSGADLFGYEGVELPQICREARCGFIYGARQAEPDNV